MVGCFLGDGIKVLLLVWFLTLLFFSHFSCLSFFFLFPLSSSTPPLNISCSSFVHSFFPTFASLVFPFSFAFLPLSSCHSPSPSYSLYPPSSCFLTLYTSTHLSVFLCSPSILLYPLPLLLYLLLLFIVSPLFSLSVLLLHPVVALCLASQSFLPFPCCHCSPVLC